ncbi:hypothetical protein BG95_01095 [Thermosipho sp. 1063]|uniref:DUF3242 domain-containing protein n=1 Tax=unclassified Thermosipho (in: thermotogales) TaxID=2676525 RepID=UPI00094938E3|nr:MULTISPECIES: DUF3242 domain-containing protein [unclassified Thermosipho (in: thermotogales)]ANQ53133.1 hypothetical protein Y592_01100 [Thermosipho sp. 1070]APT71582.1 hypothetical protein BG95_01095 [Thermosipho sp. 1063]OOC45658.1 hypothetical protein XO08_01100 [Thermosipho sp. 1074]
MKKFWILIISLVLLISSCGILFKTPSLPGSFSEKSAILLLDSFEYPLVSIGEIEEIYGVELERGLYGIFEGFNGTFYVFKYNDKLRAKENWKRFKNQFGSPLKLNYLTYSLFDRGYFQMRYKAIDIVAWWKDNWLFIITGKDVKDFLGYIDKVYGAII